MAIQIQSLTSNKQLMSQAREKLRGNWVEPVLITLAYSVIVVLLSLTMAEAHYSLFWLINLLIGGPVSVGFSSFYLAVTREKKFDVHQLKRGAQEFLKAFLTYLLVTIFIALWMLLLLIPGIIAGYSYSMVFYILCDRPELSISETLKQSKELVYGNRWKLFCLDCRFIGWFVLSLLTLGIGFLWFWPYYMTSNTCFYEDLLRQQHSASYN